MMMSLRNMLSFLACVLTLSAVGISGMRTSAAGALSGNTPSSSQTLSQRTLSSASSPQNNRRRIVSSGTKAALENLIRNILASANGQNGFSYTFTVQRAPQTDPGVQQPITVIRRPATTANVRQTATTSNRQQATTASLTRQQATASNLARQQQLSQGTGAMIPNHGQTLAITRQFGNTNRLMFTSRFGLNGDLIQLILDTHNDARRDTDIPAAAMNMIQWDDALAQQASLALETCDIRSQVQANGLGENLAWNQRQTIRMVVDNGLKEWVDEKNHFKYYDNLSTMTKHYSQMIWSNSRNIGCAAKECLAYPSSTYFLCYYRTQGNIIGEKPFVTGRQCSGCLTPCINNLCS